MAEAPTGDPPQNYYVNSQLNNGSSTFLPQNGSTNPLIGSIGGSGFTVPNSNPFSFTQPNFQIGGGPYDFKPSAKVREKLYFMEFLEKKEREVWERSCVEIFHGAKVKNSTKADLEGIERVRAHLRVLEAEIIRENKKDDPSSSS